MIAIEPLTTGYFDVVARWLATPAINRWLTADWRERPASTTTIAIAIRNRRNRFYLVRHDGSACGLVALSELDPTDKTAMLWYLLGEPSLGGRGVISHAAKDLVALAFNEFAVNSLHAWAMDGNIASLKVLQKIGFRQAGRLRRSACLDGQQIDKIYFDLLPSDWAARV